jgi:hypothetical protein
MLSLATYCNVPEKYYPAWNFVKHSANGADIFATASVVSFVASLVFANAKLAVLSMTFAGIALPCAAVSLFGNAIILFAKATGT